MPVAGLPTKSRAFARKDSVEDNFSNYLQSTSPFQQESTKYTTSLLDKYSPPQSQTLKPILKNKAKDLYQGIEYRSPP